MLYTDLVKHVWKVLEQVKQKSFEMDANERLESPCWTPERKGGKKVSTGWQICPWGFAQATAQFLVTGTALLGLWCVEFFFRVGLLLGLGLRDCIFSHYMNSVSRQRRESSASMWISVQYLPRNIYLRSFWGYSNKTRAGRRSLSSNQTRRIKTRRRNYVRKKPETPNPQQSPKQRWCPEQYTFIHV